MSTFDDNERIRREQNECLDIRFFKQTEYRREGDRHHTEANSRGSLTKCT